jgi:hypothetical protein
MTGSLQAFRIDVLRQFKSREWQAIPGPLNNRPGYRALNYLTDKGWLEQHPVNYLSQYRITDTGYEILAETGGDVTGWG